MMKSYFTKSFRLYLITGFFVSNIFPLFGQVELTFKGVYRSHVEYALIEDSILYTYHPWTYNRQTKKETTRKVVAIDVNSGKKLNTRIFTQSLSSYISPWAKHKKNILVAWEDIPYRRSDKHQVLLERFELVTVNAEERAKVRKKNLR